MLNTLKKEIQERFKKVDSKESLLDLLNFILTFYRKEALEEIKSKKTFTSKQISFFLHQLSIELDKDSHVLYDTWEITKRSGGKRKIHAPQIVGDFKALLHCLDWLIRAIYEPHPNAFGFIELKNVADNARIHAGSNYVYNIDIKDFFHSFDLNRVKLSMFNSPFNLKGTKEPVAYLIAALSTCIIDGKRVLPQGSPVSPAITNHICNRLDRRLSGLAKRFGVKYSRYADDISFSSNHNAFYGGFLTELKRIIENEGLKINEKKTRLLKKGERQEVTGITINNGLNVSVRYIKQLRMYLYFIEKYGFEKANEIYIKDIKDIRIEGDQFIKPNLQNVLKGKLNYISMVKGKNDPVYLKLAYRYNLLFESKTTIVDQTILAWHLLGINKAREMYYRKKEKEEINKNNNLRKESSTYLNIEQSSDESIHLNLKKSDYYLYKFIYENELNLWQYKNNNKEREIFAKRIVELSVKQNRVIRNFISTIKPSEIDLARTFLLKEFKQNPEKYGSVERFKLKEDGLRNYYDAFLAFKSKI
jgi:RNA-directed DNA polymerase